MEKVWWSQIRVLSYSIADQTFIFSPQLKMNIGLTQYWINFSQDQWVALTPALVLYFYITVITVI